MCINFLEIHPAINSKEDVNMGQLLLDFFDFYGEKFDFEKNGIQIGSGGKPVLRNLLPCEPVDGQYQPFCVEDVINPCLNACSVSYRASEVKKAFHQAYVALSSATSNNTDECSILGQIVYVTNDFLEYRNWIRDNFDNKTSSLLMSATKQESSQSNAVNLPQVYVIFRVLFMIFLLIMLMVI